jgi:hypothetical protein
MLTWRGSARLTLHTQSLGELTLRGLLCEVTSHTQSLGELTICEAYFVRLTLCMLNLARLTLRGLLYLYFKLCEALYLTWRGFARLTSHTQSRGELTLRGLLCEVTSHTQSLGELTICEAYFVRLALCMLNLARLTLRGLLYLYFKLCKALYLTWRGFARLTSHTQNRGEPTLQGLLCEVTLHARSLGELTMRGLI